MALRLAAALLAGGVLWVGVSLVGLRLFDSTRSLLYDTGAPRNWPVIYALRFNEADLVPEEFEVIAWTGTVGYGASGITAGGIPRHREGADVVEIAADWIEWATGQAFQARLIVDHPEEMGAVLTVRFAADGEMSVYRPGPALRAAGLGRAATLDDYERIGHVCGTALAEDDPVLARLRAQRDAGSGIDLDRIAEAGHPDAPPTACSPAPWD
ncbi:hypothetical protein HKCCE4037_16235 [Rhodobacterales bacterium HKCCE4037]|nr:hypothetical protein [Rhodobacterales bacterium HKCCE4037]